MANVTATITVKSSAGVRARQLWASLASADSDVVPLPLNAAGKATVVLTSGVAYYVFWQFYGMPGDTLSFEIKSQADAKLCELKESVVPPGKAYQAGVREFTP